jgi:hypothetical protein
MSVGGAIEVAKVMIGIHADASQVATDIRKHEGAILSSVQGLASKINGVMGAIGIGFGLSKLYGMFEAADSAADQYEETMVKLSITMQGFGKNAGFSEETLKGWIKETTDGTVIMEEEMANAAKTLLRYGDIQGDMFHQAMQAAADTAVSFGSVGSAAMSMGRALQDPERAVGILRRAGIMLSDEQRDQVKSFMASGEKFKAQQVIMQAFAPAAGGAKKFALTGPGMEQGLEKTVKEQQIAMGQIYDDLGNFLTKVRIEFNKVVIVIGESVKKIVDVFTGWYSSLGEIPQAILKVSVAVVAFVGVLGLLAPAAAMAWTAITGPVALAAYAIVGVTAAIVVVYKWLSSMPAVTAAWNRALDTLSVAWDRISVQLKWAWDLAVSTFDAFMKWAGLGDVFDGVDSSIGNVVANMIDAVAGFVADAAEWFQVLSTNVSEVWSGMTDAVKYALSKVGDVFSNTFTSYLPEMVQWCITSMKDAWEEFTTWLMNRFMNLSIYLQGVMARLPGIITAATMAATIAIGMKADPINAVKNILAKEIENEQKIAGKAFDANVFKNKPGKAGAMPEFKPGEESERTKQLGEKVGGTFLDLLQKKAALAAERKGLEDQARRRRIGEGDFGGDEGGGGEFGLNIPKGVADKLGNIFKDATRSSFPDLGKKIQDYFLKQGTGELGELKRIGGLMEQGNALQKQIADNTSDAPAVGELP